MGEMLYRFELAQTTYDGRAYTVIGTLNALGVRRTLLELPAAIRSLVTITEIARGAIDGS